MQLIKSISSLLLLLLSYSNKAQNLQTHNIIYSNPIDTTIKIDGNINDWPSNLNHYPIEKPLQRINNKNEGNFSAYFMTGYNLNQNALYLAIVVEDDMYFSDKDNPSIRNQDSYSLYLNEKYSRVGSGVGYYAITENYKELMNASNNWDPKLKELLDWKKVDYKISTKDKQRIYELKITLQKPIYDGRVIGLDHIINDVDKDSQTRYGWVNSSNKDATSQPGKIGALVFHENPRKLGTITGKVSWRDSAITTKPEGVILTSKKNNRFWIYLPVDNDGRFSTLLPKGEYVLTPGKLAFFSGYTFYKANSSITKTIKVKEGILNDEVNYYLQPEKTPYFEEEGNFLYDISENGKQKIDETIKAHMQFYGIEGVAFAALKNGKITYHNTYGVKNNYTKEKVTEETLFEVASITKPVFAYAVLRLYEKGLIDLDKPLYEYLPFDIISDDEYSKLITARIVLSHQTGLPNWRRNGVLKFKFKPGTTFGYSGEGYEYLKRVIEKITNKEINEVLNEEVVTPLELEHMYFKKNEYAAKYKSSGHYNSYPGKIDLPENPWVAGCLITNAKSFAKFIIALQNRKGLKPETFEMMLSYHTNVPQDFRENIWGFDEYMGLGLFVEKTPFGNVLRHSGDNGDFQAVFKLYDDLDMAYIIMLNSNSGHFLLDNIEKILIDVDELSKIKQ
ncbi:hypothetical protein D7030_02780 [Flavobacteriaceae bacterium AU392]|nr:hypothetical protein D1817_09255 [Flavobacteriaceae bacterium]RKM85614.1 hypothetical protein D7030_02780 [Flavobacteriaceae bacterium AU392]